MIVSSKKKFKPLFIALAVTTTTVIIKTSKNLNELKNCDIVFLNGFKKNQKLKNKIKKINFNIKIFDAIYEPTNLKQYNLKKKNLFFCGIGNPHEFENTLKKFKFKKPT